MENFIGFKFEESPCVYQFWSSEKFKMLDIHHQCAGHTEANHINYNVVISFRARYFLTGNDNLR